MYLREALIVLVLFLSVVFIAKNTNTTPDTNIKSSFQQTNSTSAEKTSTPIQSTTNITPASASSDLEKCITDRISSKYSDLWDDLGAQVETIIEDGALITDIDVDSDQDAKDWNDTEDNDKRQLLISLLNDITLQTKAYDISLTISYDDQILSSAYYLKDQDKFTIYENGDDSE